MYRRIVCSVCDKVYSATTAVRYTICVACFSVDLSLFKVAPWVAPNTSLSSPKLIRVSCPLLYLRSYKMGRLTLHDLHEQNLEAMQCVVDLGRQLGRPIFTSLWSSRADRPNVGAPGEMMRYLYLQMLFVLFPPSRLYQCLFAVLQLSKSCAFRPVPRGRQIIPHVGALVHTYI